MTLCMDCGQEIPEDKDSRQKFCGRSCAATYNNRFYPKRVASRLCDHCGRKLTTKSRLCQDCLNMESLERTQNRPISGYMLKGTASRARNNPIRRWARRTLLLLGRDKKCQVCGFEAVVEVCHIVPITDFPENTLMKVVNSPDNLVYLCPNHHAMLDKGRLQLP